MPFVDGRVGEGPFGTQEPPPSLDHSPQRLERRRRKGCQAFRLANPLFEEYSLSDEQFAMFAHHPKLESIFANGRDLTTEKFCR